MDALLKLDLQTVVVATSDEYTDDVLADTLAFEGIPVYRGPKEDIAARALQCCEAFGLDYFIRVNGDSPFVNLPLLREGISLIDSDIDIVTNLAPRSYPYGMSNEIVKVDRFADLYQHFTEEEKIHITSYYYKNLKDITFKPCTVVSPEQSHVRLTIDTPEDYATIQYYLCRSRLTEFNDIAVDDLIQDYKHILDDKFIFNKA